MRIGLLQHACTHDATENLAVAESLAAQAVAQGAQLLVTQELFTGPYFPLVQDPAFLKLAEPIPGPTTRALAGWAKRWGVHVAGSLFERRGPGLHHNTAVWLDPTGEITGRYRKTHIPDDPGFSEKYYFTPGDLGFPVHALSHGDDPLNLGMLICWDQWFPEAARLMALGGAELITYPTAIGGLDRETPQEHDDQLDAWITVQRAHAIANGVYVAAVNRIGHEGDKTFWGSSFVADPMGRIIAQASRDEPEALVVDIDPALIDTTRRECALFLRDRRVDAYGDLLKLWRDET